MGYRVYDNEDKCWIKDNVYLNPDGDLFLIKQSLFGAVKTPLLLDVDRYTYHKDIGLQDRNGEEIYEGDYLLARVDEDKSVIGLVSFVNDLSAYVILCTDSDEFYTLGSEVCEFIEIVGNVFDGYEVEENGEQTLQETEE